MKEERIFYLILGLIAIILPFLVTPSQVDLLLRTILLACAALGLQLLMSYAGQISLGHAAFMGLGAYISAIISIQFNLPPLLTIPLAAVITAIIAYIIGFPLLRLRGNYLAIGTLAFGMAVLALITSLYKLTGGPGGLVGIPEIGWGNIQLKGKISYYFVSVGLFALFYWYARNLLRTRIGRALVTLKNSEHTAEAMGVATSRIKLQVFVISASFSALAGAVLAHYLGFIVPSQFGVLISVELLVFILLGGEFILLGSLIGALVWSYLSEITHYLDVPRPLIVGIVIVLLILFFKGGISAGALRIYSMLRRNKEHKVTLSAENKKEDSR